MKTAALVLVASAALASAQVTIVNGTYECAKPNAQYCAGSSLGTDIIIRCNATAFGQPGRCTDNLAGEPPLGVNPALCWQTSETSGDAACEKNCVVYAAPASFTLPASVCTPYFTATSSSSSTSSTSSSSSTTSGSSSSSSGSSSSTSKSASSSSSSSTVTVTSSSSTTLTVTSSSQTSSTPTQSGGGTPTPTPTKSQGGGGSSPSPSKSSPSQAATAGAALNQAGGALAVAGLVAAYFI